MARFTTHFFGNEISEYGRQNGRVDYRTFAKAFDAVLNNDIMSKTADIGYWEQESGFVDNSEEIEELQEQIDELCELITMESTEEADAETFEKIDELQRQLDELESEQDEQPEIYQWYIIDDNGAEICKEFNEVVYYNEELDIYLWGVDHYGTSWDYVLTDIPCEKNA